MGRKAADTKDRWAQDNRLAANPAAYIAVAAMIAAIVGLFVLFWLF
jgi:hypothetical protein